MAASNRFRFAQITDAHLGPLPPFAPRHWNLKRALGYINYTKNRKHGHDPDRLSRMIDYVKAQPLDHITVTGDLTNLGMPQEFENALEWLQSIGPPDDVTVIPGNHDVYTRLVRDPGIERWRPYMSARDDHDRADGVPPPTADGFPFVRLFGQFALIGVNSAVYMPPAVPAGRVGKAQTDRLIKILNKLDGLRFVRIVLIHHPPLSEHGTRRGLRDGAAFEAAIASVGCELMIHGHNHRDMISWRGSPGNQFPIVGAAAAADGKCNIYEIDVSSEGPPQITVTRIVPDHAGRTFSSTSDVLTAPDFATAD